MSIHSTALIVTVCLLYTYSSVLGKSRNKDDNGKYTGLNDDSDIAEYGPQKPHSKSGYPHTEKDDDYILGTQQEENNNVYSSKKKQNTGYKNNKGRGKAKGKYKQRTFNPSENLKEYVKAAREAYRPQYDKFRESWNKTIEVDHNIEADQVKYIAYLLDKFENTENGKRQIDLPYCIRKEYRSLTDDERERYHNAVRTLKTTYFEGSSASKYDLIAELHHDNFAPVAHFTPCFLPWHREYLLIYEIALREIDTSVCLPYLDTCIDGKLRNQNYNTAIFDTDTLGNAWNRVTTGAFGDFVPYGRCNTNNDRLFRYVQREWGILHNENDFDIFDSYRDYSDIAFPRGRAFEYAHGGPHVWIQGHMSDLNCAASDPIFFMHHCYIDFLWERFREQFQTTYPPTDYVSDDDLDGFRVDQRAYPYFPMLPFGDLREMIERNITLKRTTQVFNIDGLSYDYAGWYGYETAPCHRECVTDSDCGTARVWCRDSECVAQVREGRWCHWDSGIGIRNPRSCFCKDPNATPTCGRGNGETRICTCVTDV